MRLVFDTESVLKYFLGEEGAEEVKEYFEDCRDGEKEGFMSLANFTELYYILCRESEDLAEEKLTSLLGFGMETVGIEEDKIWKMAAKIKADEAIPLGDSYAAATAEAKGAKLVVGRDEHFQDLGLDTIRMASDSRNYF